LASVKPPVPGFQERAARCGVPAAYGGQSIQAYLDNKTDKLVLPWTVAIRNNLGKFKCLGSIIPDIDHSAMQRNSSALVLTAGSCFRHSLRKKWGTPRHYKVYAGLDRLHLFLNRGEKSRARAIRIMPYNAVNENIWNGVAVVTLKKPFVFNKHISPVCLAGEHSVPPDTSFCFVSTYHKRRLDEEVVRMVPGSVCRFGHFPELARTGGLCSHHERADTEKSLGGPLVCMVNGIAYQFGVYLSQLITRKALSFHKQALHFYGHVTTALEKDPLTASNVIQLGSTGAHSKSSESSSSSASKPQQGCAHPPPPPPQPVYCGDTITFGRTLQSYVVGNNAQDMFPWNVIITTRVRGSTRCIGSLVHKGHERQAANSSDVVLTAADCFNGKDNVVPVCLAQRESVPPPYASCYVTHYDKHEHRIDEEIVMVTRNARCLAAQGSNAPQFRGICAVEEKKKHYIQLGSPMVCIVHGRAYQYGVYLNQLSLKINDKVKQNLGFYSEITIVHDVFAGRNVPTLPDRAHLHPGSKPHKPVRASSSSSSSGSHELYKRPIGHVPNPVGSPLLCQSSGTWTQFGIYDHSVRKAVSYSAGRSVKQEQSEIALFMKLEDDDVARIQTLQTNSI
ncbi:trypsin, partial [Trichuris suis]